MEQHVLSMSSVNELAPTKADEWREIEGRWMLPLLQKVLDYVMENEAVLTKEQMLEVRKAEQIYLEEANRAVKTSASTHTRVSALRLASEDYDERIRKVFE